mmetsp:Transcript_30326/g.96964  ORF Transcript_30326/g.96964 Transcript_30326/m.96964 type:complete len:202 (+) Transcript_30326:368-973(+)
MDSNRKCAPVTVTRAPPAVPPHLGATLCRLMGCLYSMTSPPSKSAPFFERYTDPNPGAAAGTWGHSAVCASLPARPGATWRSNLQAGATEGPRAMPLSVRDVPPGAVTCGGSVCCSRTMGVNRKTRPLAVKSRPMNCETSTTAGPGGEAGVWHWIMLLECHVPPTSTPPRNRQRKTPLLTKLTPVTTTTVPPYSGPLAGSS